MSEDNKESSVQIELVPTKTKVHSLLGSQVEQSGDQNEICFLNGVNLSTHSYIGDHKLGDIVLFPGASFLEMCLGVAKMKSKSSAYVIEDFVIKSAVVMDKVNMSQLKTVVCMNSKDDVDIVTPIGIKIYANDGQPDSEKWKIRSESKLLVDVTAIMELIPTQFEKLDELRNSCRTPAWIDGYTLAMKCGCRPGPLFQSVKNVWVNDTRPNDLLVGMSISRELKDETNVCHPIVLDSMIQAYIISCIMSITVEYMYIPVAIKRFIWLKTDNDSEPLDKDPEVYFVHVEQVSEDEKFATLYTSGGQVLAILSGLGTVPMTVASLGRAVGASISSNNQ